MSELDGLKTITKYVNLYWDEKNGWSAIICDNEADSDFGRGYGDFAGASEVVCVVPEGAE